MYDPKSMKAEDFINDAEIQETIAWAESHKEDAELIDAVIAKAKLLKGLSHREAALLLMCTLEDRNQEIFHLAKEIKRKFYGDRIVMSMDAYTAHTMRRTGISRARS